MGDIVQFNMPLRKTNVYEIFNDYIFEFVEEDTSQILLYNNQSKNIRPISSFSGCDQISLQTVRKDRDLSKMLHFPYISKPTLVIQNNGLFPKYTIFDNFFSSNGEYWSDIIFPKISKTGTLSYQHLRETKVTPEIRKIYGSLRPLTSIVGQEEISEYMKTREKYQENGSLDLLLETFSLK